MWEYGTNFYFWNTHYSYAIPSEGHDEPPRSPGGFGGRYSYGIILSALVLEIDAKILFYNVGLGLISFNRFGS